MDAEETYNLGHEHGVTVGKMVASFGKPILKLTLLGMGVLILVGTIYPEVTKTKVSS